MASAQNLVPNWSFEDTVQCPNSAGEIINASGWFNPSTNINSTPDYYNACSSTMNVPNYGIGLYQDAKDGNAYAGVFTFQKPYTDAREYIETMLIKPLEKGKKYCVSFYVNRSDFADYSCANIGAYFSSSQILTGSFLVLPLNPQVNNTLAKNALKDSVNWMLISGSFFANGGEQYITIGNFNNDATSDTINQTHSAFASLSYYFIDDVSVIECRDSIIIPNVFTPNGDGINDLFKIETSGISTLECTIYNRWGIKIAEVNSSTGYIWDGRTISGIDAVQGVYYYIMNATGVDGQDYQQKGFVHLLR